MTPTKVQTEPQTKAMPTTLVGVEPALPDKRVGMARPESLQHAGNMVAPLHANLGAPIRARMATAVQRTVGNDRLGRLPDSEHGLRRPPLAAGSSLGVSATVVQRQAAPDHPAPLGHEHRRRSRSDLGLSEKQ